MRARDGFLVCTVLASAASTLWDVKTHLRRLRFERGELSQAQLAELVAVSRQTIIAIERGDYNPSVKLALLLAKVLGSSVEHLFELEANDAG